MKNPVTMRALLAVVAFSTGCGESAEPRPAPPVPLTPACPVGSTPQGTCCAPAPDQTEALQPTLVESCDQCTTGPCINANLHTQAFLCEPDPGPFEGVYVSDDGGSTFEWRGQGLVPGHGTSLHEQGIRGRRVLPHPTAPDRILLEASPLFRWDGPGTTAWSRVEPAGLPGKEVRDLVYLADRTTLLGLSTTGTYDTGLRVRAVASGDDGDHFSDRSEVPTENGCTVGSTGLIVHPTDPAILWSDCDGAVRSNDGGRTWTALHDPEVDVEHGVRPIIVHGGASSRLYGIRFGPTRVIASDDLGDSWHALRTWDGVVTPEMAPDPSSPARILVLVWGGNEVHLEETRDAGATWSSLGPAPGIGPLFAQGGSGALLAASSVGSCPGGGWGSLLRTADLHTWIPASGGLPPANIAMCLRTLTHSVAFDPKDPQRVYLFQELTVPCIE